MAMESIKDSAMDNPVSIPSNLRPNTRAINLIPKETYKSTSSSTTIRVGNGGAGPTGLLKSIAEDYQQICDNASTIEWYQNISPLTLQALADGEIDVAMTYERKEEEDAIRSGFVRWNPVLLFNDHFILCGPTSNPAGLDSNDTPEQAYGKIALWATENVGIQIYLSRNDQSATHLKELGVWNLLGVDADAPWRVCNTVFPADALRQADCDALYTLTDHGTFTMLRRELRRTSCYVSGGDLLRNPCNALIGVHARAGAQEFVEYIVSPRGQSVIERFGLDGYGYPMFTKASQLDLTTI